MSGRILVVDDVISNIILLESRLIGMGLDVVTASSGRECLAKLTQEAPDLVLLDVMMPELDGTEVCRLIRADPETASIPVVLVTALGEAEAKDASMRAGADGYLVKPMSDEMLFACLQRFICKPYVSSRC